MTLVNRNVFYDKEQPKRVRLSFEYQCLVRFCDWLDTQGLHWTDASLDSFVGYLAELAPDDIWIKKHIESIQKRYLEVVDELSHEIMQAAAQQTSSLEEMIQKIDEIQTRLRNQAALSVDDIVIRAKGAI